MNKCGIRIYSKRGSSTVFLSVIMATLISIVLLLLHGVRTEAEISIVDGIVNLAGDSVLAEYDRNLQEEYGLFLLKGTNDELSKKLHYYINDSINDMEDMRIEQVEVLADRYSVINVSLIKNQILSHMKVIAAEEITDRTLENRNSISNTENTIREKTLRHGPTIASLPSALVPDKSLTALAESLAGKAKDAEIAFKSGTEGFMINEYVFSCFNSSHSIIDDKHFFRNEVEYILGGELSDQKNEKRVEMALKAMRFVINMMHLYTDSEKQALLTATAQVMTPGAAAAATQAALASTWAYAEADNDVELLKQGHKIPMIKDKDTWAIELDTAVNGLFGETVIPNKEKGYSYEEYLMILLFFQDENIKLARILDLIQINMRTKYDENFLINDYASGISVRVKVNGKLYLYEKKY